MSNPQPARDDAFAAWLGVVESRTRKVFDLSLAALPELPLRHAFDRGIRPHLFLFETVMPVLRERYGSAADFLLEVENLETEP